MVEMRFDYADITEQPGSHLNLEQVARFVHRYAMASALTRGRIFEAACGAAIGLGSLQSAGRPVTGLCYTSAVLHQAQAHYQGRVPLLCGDAQQLPVATAAFDTVLCLEAIYYFSDPAAFLAEARRVLTPGGVLLVASSNPDWPHFVRGNLARHYPTAPELVSWLQLAGFRAVKLYGAFALSHADGRHATALRLRRLILCTGLDKVIGSAALHLKRLVYGRLEQLPSELPVDVLRQAAQTLNPSPLPPDQPDRLHRVLYALGHAPGS
jgi:ubiquinone/menaquinone biosynthesis C-methylase UbiE